MKLFDANILLYAVDSGSSYHAKCKRLLEDALSQELVAFSWEGLSAFLRIITNSRVYTTPLSSREAAQYVDQWLSRSNSSIVTATDEHWQVFSELLHADEVRANLVMDAHLAALAICHGAQLYSTDSDFARFRNLKWHLVR